MALLASLETAKASLGHPTAVPPLSLASAVFQKQSPKDLGG
jgi:hypothetical protein